MTRAELVAAALERWEKWSRLLSEADDSDAEAAVASDLAAAGDALASLLREAQPEPAPVVGDDEALLARVWNLKQKTTTLERDLAMSLTAALADLARAEARPSRYEDLMAIEQLQVQVDHYRTGMIESRAALADVARLAHALSDSARELKRVISERDAARAALAAAVQEKEKAVAEEREAIAAAIDKMAALAAIHYDETSQRAAAVLEDAAVEIRARAGRNDVG